jgi:hypothetical protein
MATGEDVASEIQLRDALSAALAIAGILCAQEPWSGAAKVALCPRERHVLLNGFPLLVLRATPAKKENDSINLWCDLDGSYPLAAAIP